MHNGVRDSSGHPVDDSFVIRCQSQTYDASISGESKPTITVILLAERPGGAEDDLLQVDALDIVKA